jgi:RNA polymerase sigma-70 factor (ECF subfamily)
MAPHPPLESDDELLPRIAAGDRNAFAALFRRRQGDVYRFALHMTGSAAMAEDVTQDVFIAVMGDAGRFDPGRGSVTAWLCGVARNHARRRLERERTGEPIGDANYDFGHVLAVTPDPLADLTHAERLETLRRSVLSLPARYREVVVLCDLQDMTYADAAAALDCAIGTVRSRLHRGRALLASKMLAAESAGGQNRKIMIGGSRCCA